MHVPAKLITRKGKQSRFKCQFVQRATTFRELTANAE